MSQPVAEVGAYKNITATGAVTSGPCQLIGFYVNSTTIGTLVLKDGGSGGTALGGTITPAIEPFSTCMLQRQLAAYGIDEYGEEFTTYYNINQSKYEVKF